MAREVEYPRAATVILWIIALVLLAGLGYGVSLIHITGTCQADIMFNMTQEVAKTAKNLPPGIQVR